MLKSVFEWVVMLAVVAFFSMVFSAAVIDWAAGCGETFVDAKGISHVGQCVYFGGGK